MVAYRFTSISIINYIYDNGDDLTKQDVDDIICEYYKNNEYSGLERILKSWNELPYYATRRKQIRVHFMPINWDYTPYRFQYWE